MDSQQKFMLISALAGIVTAMIPDRWMPSSLVSWKSGWNASMTSVFSAGLLLVHVLAGVLLFSLFAAQLEPLRTTNSSLQLGAFLLAGILLRYFRFSNLQQIVRTPATTPVVRQTLTVLSLMGPNEVILPILIKASGSHAHMIQATVSYTVGLVVTGAALTVVGRKVWSSPAALPRGIRMTEQGMTLLPLILGMGLTLVAISKVV